MDSTATVVLPRLAKNVGIWIDSSHMCISRRFAWNQVLVGHLSRFIAPSKFDCSHIICVLWAQRGNTEGCLWNYDVFTCQILTSTRDKLLSKLIPGSSVCPGGEARYPLGMLQPRLMIFQVL